MQEDRSSIEAEEDNVNTPFGKGKKKPFSVVQKQKEDRQKRRERKARIIVRNLSYKSTEESLKTIFEKYGEIKDFNLLKRADGKLVGCAFVQYAKVNDAAKVIAKLNGKEVLGRAVFIDWAIDKNKYEKTHDNKSSVKDIKAEIKEELEIESDIPDQLLDESEIKSESESGIDEELDSDDDDYLADSNSDTGDCNVEEDGSSDDENDEKTSKGKIKVELDAEPKKGRKSNDVAEGCTVFIKNVPFEATNDDLAKCCKQFGPIYYALITIDKISGHSKGTGFVKFKSKDSADMCLRAGTEFKLLNAILDPCPALTREDIKQKTTEKNKKVEKDNRNLYLLKEGLILAGTPSALGVSQSDMAKRIRLEQIKGQMLKNLNRFVSRIRLSIHNLPPSYDNEKLHKMVTRNTKLKPKECRVMRENKPSMGNPLGKSKGFGFLSFDTHEEALTCLRKINNNPTVFGKNNRPIVGFSLEDKKVHKLKERRLKKSRENNPYFNKELVPHESKTNKDKKPKLKKLVKNSTTDIVPKEASEFSGVQAKPGKINQVRPSWKLKDQIKTHNKQAHSAIKAQRKMKERQEIRQEKREIDRTKNRKRKSKTVDSFSFMVDKYKNLIKSTEATPTPSKRTKWYVED